MPTTSAAAPSNFPTSAPTSSPLADWASRVTPALAKLRAACSQTAQDAEIEALTDVLERAFGAEEAVLRQVAASASPPPDAAALERLLEPVAVVAGEADKLANPAGGRGRAVPKRLNQAKAVSELIPALLCVAYSGPSCGEKEEEEFRFVFLVFLFSSPLSPPPPLRSLFFPHSPSIKKH